MSSSKPATLPAFKRGALAVAAVAVAASLFHTAMPQPATGQPQVSQAQVQLAASWRNTNKNANTKTLSAMDGVSQQATVEPFPVYLQGDGRRVLMGAGGMEIQYHLQADRGTLDTVAGERAMALQDFTGMDRSVANTARQAIEDIVRGQRLAEMVKSPQAFSQAVLAETQQVLDNRMGGASVVVIDRVDLGRAVEQVLDPATHQILQGQEVALGAAARSSLADALEARRAKELQAGAQQVRAQDADRAQACRKHVCG